LKAGGAVGPGLKTGCRGY